MKAKKFNSDVVVMKGVTSYPSFPYAPTGSYPELGCSGSKDHDDVQKNNVFEAVRSIIASLGLDSDQFGKSEWNPFSELVPSGGSVLIKPNWVRDYNVIPEYGTDCLLTHTSVIRPLIDYAAKAVGVGGRVIIADAPLQNCDFEKLVDLTNIRRLVETLGQIYPGVDFIVEDWRLTVTERSNFVGFSAGTRKNQGSADRCKVVDLGVDSLHSNLDSYGERFRVTCYDPSLMVKHHSSGRHEYLVTKRIFDVDLVVNVPVLKTHIKAGVTGALKNLVGINGHKEYLPHHIKGGFLNGGDNFYSDAKLKLIWEDFDEWYWKDPNRFNKVVRAILGKTIHFGWKAVGYLVREPITGGGWAGNDTLWRTIIDLNHILYFFDDRTEKLTDEPVRNVLNIVDAVVAGQGEGPLSPQPIGMAEIYGGFNPSSVEMYGLKRIGYNIERIRTVSAALYDIRSKFNLGKWGIPKFKEITSDGLKVVSWNSLEKDDFKLPLNWKRAAEND